MKFQNPNIRRGLYNGGNGTWLNDVFNLNNDTMTTEQNEIKSAEWRKNNLSKNSFLADVGGSLRFSEREVDFAYLCGVFNTSGIDGLHTEIQRLKELGKEPHDIIEACRKQ